MKNIDELWRFMYELPNCILSHQYGPLTRCVTLRVVHALGMPGTFSPPPRVCDPDMHHGTCVMRVPWCMLGSLISRFFWSRLRGKGSRHSRHMRKPRFYVSGKRPMKYTHHLYDDDLLCAQLPCDTDWLAVCSICFDKERERELRGIMEQNYGIRNTIWYSAVLR